MDAPMLREALDAALADEAFAAAFDGASSISISEGEDGSITLDAGSESVVIGAEDLMGEAGEGDDAPLPPVM